MLTEIALVAALAMADEAGSAGSGGAATAVPQAQATAKAPLREIGHVKAVTNFCRRFFEHFNGAVHPILQNDAEAGYIGYTLGTIEPHFHQRAGELALYDDRVKLTNYVDLMMGLIPVAQREVDELRRTAAATTNPDEAKEAHDVAADLQRALDKQKQIAYDSQHVVQAMIEFSTGANSMGLPIGDPRSSAQFWNIWVGITGPRASTELQSNVPGGYDPYQQSTPSEMRDVRSYLHYQNQLDRIGDAEGQAATTADTVVSNC